MRNERPPLLSLMTLLLVTGSAVASAAPALATGMHWSTFLGGTGIDVIHAVVVDPSGDVVMVGYSASADYPTTAGAYQRTKAEGNDVVVTKVRADGTLAWSTFLGGNAADVGRAVTVDAAGNVVVVGETMSTDFPVTAGAFRTQTGMAGTYDAFVTKLSPDGRALVYSTYLGGTSADYARAVAVDATGRVSVGGYTGSTNFPTTSNVVKSTRYPAMFDASDGFVTQLNESGGALVYSTYVGSDAGTDIVYALALDASGRATVAGWTASSSFPTTSGAFDRTFGGVKDGFVTGLQTGGTGYRFSTYIGGAGLDEARGLGLDGAGNAVVAGFTISTDLPTTPGVVQGTAGGGGAYDGFVAGVSATGALAFCCYLGGSGSDAVYGVALGPAGDICITGSTTSTNFPVSSGAYGPGYEGGAADAFLTALGPGATALRYSSYLGSGGNDQGQALDICADGEVVAIGSSDGPDFPTGPEGWDMTFNGAGASDGFASCLDIGLSGGGTTAVEPGAPGALQGPWPNPFRAQTRVSLVFSHPTPVQVGVFDVVGRQVRILGDESAASGQRTWIWDGRDEHGKEARQGCYFVVIRTPGAVERRLVTLLR